MFLPKIQKHQHRSSKLPFGEVSAQHEISAKVRLFPALSLVLQPYNSAMPAKKFYLNFLMPAERYDKSYKGLFILSEGRNHQHQAPETDHQGLPEKLRALKSLIPNQQSQSNTHILTLSCTGWITGI